MILAVGFYYVVLFVAFLPSVVESLRRPDGEPLVRFARSRVPKASPDSDR